MPILNNKKIWVAIVIIAVVVLVGLRVYWGRQSNTGPIKIGGALGLTGIAAQWGEGELKAIQLVLEEQNKHGRINGRKLELVVEDTQSTPNGTVNAVSKLINIDKVQVIIGPTWGDSFGGGSPIAEQAKIVMISPSLAIEAAKSDVDYKFLFSTWFPQKGEVDFLQKFAVRNRHNHFVVVHEVEPFSTMMTKLFQGFAPINGISVDNVLEFQANDSDFSTTVIKLKSLRPQAIFFENSSLGVSGVGIFVKKLRDLGIGTQVFSTSYIQDPEILKYSRFVNGLIFSHAKPVHELDILKSIEGPSTSNAYDAAQAVIAVLKTGAQTGEEIKNGLHKIKIPGTTFQEVSFNELGQVNGGEFEMKKVENGEFVALPQ